MQAWAVQDAKARFSELLETCITSGPQLVTKRGAGAAVLVPLAEWQRMAAGAGPTLKDILLGDGWRGEMNVPPRGKVVLRPLLDLSD